MPIYDPKLSDKYSNPNYLISLLEEEKKDKEIYPEYTEEQPIVEEPPKNRTISDLRNDEAFMEKGQIVFEYLNENKSALGRIFTASSDYDADIMANMRKVQRQGEAPDIIEMLRDEDYRLPTLFSHAGLLEDAPENVLRAYKDIRQEFDNADLGSFKEFVTAAGDIGTDIVTDPVNFLGLLAIPFTGGGSAAAKAGAQQLAKTTIQRNLASKLQAFATPAVVGGLEGGVFTGLDDYGRQTRDIATGIQDATEVDMQQVARAAGLGVGLGAGIGKMADMMISKLDKKIIQRAASPEETTSTDLAEQGMIGDLLDAEGIGYGKERLGLDKDTSDFIEGVFEVINDEEAVADLVKKFAAKKNISEEGAEEILDGLMDNFNPVQSKGGIFNTVSKVVDLAKQAPAIYGGKVSTLLDPYAAKSDTVASLQKKFRYDMQRTFFGERTMEGADYSETLGDILGGYYTNMKEAVDPVLQGNYGKNRDDAYLALSNAIRGKASGDEVIDNAASLIRKDLDRAADELKDAGLYDESRMLTENYFPRMWNRKAIVNNQQEFARLLIKNGEAKDGAEAQGIIESMLSKNEDFGDSASYGNFFLSKRVFNKIEDDTAFSKFLDNDTQNVLLSYYSQISKQLARKKVFGASNWNQFEYLYKDQLVKELGRVEGGKALNTLKTVWGAQTGEGQEISKFQGVVDSVTTLNRLALLPLATVSSLTEILLNLSRGGVQSTVKNFGKAVAEGAHILTYEMADRLTKNHGISKPEAYRKMQRFGIALEQAAADQVERLSGESVKSPMLQKVNRAFFRLNLLEPWTKTVQLTSFNVGKDLIRDNLKAIARHGDKPMNARMKTKVDQLLELNVDVDDGINWLNRTGGDLDVDDKFLYNIERGAARYTNEVILNPTRESGLRSLALSKSPFTTMLFQLTTYPAAFTNTVLKDMVKRVARGAKQGDIGASGKVIGTALTMQAAAMTLNYARNAQLNKDPEYRYKSDAELLRDGLARWGGNGVHFDMVQRATKASEFLGVPGAVFAAPFGPIGGQIVSGIQSRSFATPLASMTPFYAALPKETRAEIRKGAKQLFEETPKYRYAKGGEVLDVPNAPTEPDQRIDKMTGQPYDQQAGTAFVDEEDPLRRMGFVGGGLSKLIKLGIKAIDDADDKVFKEAVKEGVKNVDDTIRPYESVPRPATYEEMNMALDARKKEKINVDIPDGQKVGLRLDIPAYTRHDVWVPTIHDEGGTKLTSHRATAAIKDVDLLMKESDQIKGEKIKNREKPKSPFARIGGKLINRSDEENYALAQKYLNDPEWTQVGYNPDKHSYFFDRATGDPIIGGDEAIQIGPLVLVKNAVKGDRKDFRYAKGGKVLSSLQRRLNGI